MVNTTVVQTRHAQRQGVPLLALALAGGALLLRLLRGDGNKAEGEDSEPSAAPVTVEWRELTATLSKGSTATPLLSRVSGAALHGRLTAILGPSGAGKTTLLNALVGQLPYAAGLRLSGAVLVNRQPLSALPASSLAYVQQEDAFFSTLTVKETLSLAAELRLPKARCEERTTAVLRQLGLERVARTPVGGGKLRGISGGERKRLSIASALLSSPSVLALDEPTSGLDSASALAVMLALKSAAAQGRCVLASIHQPRSSIFSLFNDVIVLAEGGVCLYSGPAASALDWFASCGVDVPEHTNAADVLIDAAAIDFSSPEAEAESRARVRRLAASWAARSSESQTIVAAPLPSATRSMRLPLWTQLRLLGTRAWRQATRDTVTASARFGSSVGSALLFGALFWRLGRSQAAIQSRLGLLNVVAVNAAMTSMVKCLQLFSVERSVIDRERSVGAYGVGSYLAAKIAAELPTSALYPALFGALVYPSCGLSPGLGRLVTFLGVITLESFTASAYGMTISALLPSGPAAVSVGPALMVPHIVFGGLFINPQTIPWLLRSLPKASLIKHAFEALSVNELEGATFEAMQPGDAATGQQVLRRLGFEGSSVGGAAAAQVAVLLTNWGATFLLLRRKSPRYARLGDEE